jgi:hypothetical protein
MDTSSLNVCFFRFCCYLYIFQINVKFINEFQSGDVGILQVSIVEKLSELPHLCKVGIPCIISDPEINRYG